MLYHILLSSDTFGFVTVASNSEHVHTVLTGFHGSSQVAAQTGHSVTIVDQTKDILQHSRASIEKSVSRVSKKKFKDDANVSTKDNKFMVPLKVLRHKIKFEGYFSVHIFVSQFRRLVNFGSSSISANGRVQCAEMWLDMLFYCRNRF